MAFVAPVEENEAEAGFTAPAVEGFSAPAEDGPVEAPKPGPRGYLDDPVQDKKAYEQAAEMYRVNKPGAFQMFQDALGANIDRPMQGLYSAAVGDGYNYGKVVDRYKDEMAAEEAGGWGTAAKVAGSIMTPSPVKGGGGIVSNMVEGGLTSLAEGQALSVEGDDRSLTDAALDVGIGSGAAGALTAVGKAVSPKAPALDSLGRGKTSSQAADVARTATGAPKVEQAGEAFQEALVREQAGVYGAGREAMKEATEGAAEFTNRPGARLQMFTRQNYPNVRASTGAQPIPITPEGTPATFALQQAIDKIGENSPEGLSLKGIDTLRTQARGLRANAANTTDRAALDDLVKTIDNFIDDSISAGHFEGDEHLVEIYRAGRDKVSKALTLKDTGRLRQVIDDETIPGTAIADSLLSINTPAKSKQASKAANMIVETLGEESDSLAAVRSGVVSNVLEGLDDSAASQKKVLKILDQNRNLVDNILNPQQKEALAELEVNLRTLTKGVITRSSRKNVGKALTNGLSKVVTTLSSPTKSGAIAGVATGSAGIGLGVGGVLAALKAASNPIVRSVTGEVLQGTSRGLARQAAQNDPIREATGAMATTVQQYAQPNERDEVINQLQGAN